MMTKKCIPLYGILLLANTTLVTADFTDHQQQATPQTKEPIPDDIWNSIASPFDPIRNQSAFTPPQRRVEQMRPQQKMVRPVQPAPQPLPQSTPQAPSRPMVQDLSIPTQTAPPRERYSAPVEPTPIPYELPPQVKVAVAEYPEEYWNCLLNNLQGVGSDVAAKLITRACQKKHPKR